MEVGGCVQVSLRIFFLNHPKILSVYTLLKVVSYYDLSVLSISVMGFQKKVWMRVGRWGELYPSIFGILLTLQSPLMSMFQTRHDRHSIHHG